MQDDIQHLLGELHFKGMANALERELQRAEKNATPAPELLWRLLQEEACYRKERHLAYRLSEANIPWPWTMDTFPFARQPGVDKAQILALAGLDFLRRAENLVLVGNTGTGKSGIAIALLRQACLNGYRGRFYDAQELLDELYASLADRSTPRLLHRLSRYEPLVIDELGYLTLKPEQANAFFKLMEKRYARTSTIITTNLELADWYGLFQPKDLVDALLDRLQHHCITLRINGPSLRVPDPEPATTKTPKRAKKTPNAALG